MRLATIDTENWQTDAPFIDTLCLPIYSISVKNKLFNHELGRIVEEVANLVEKKLQGRLLLLPPICYTGNERLIFRQYLDQVLSTLLESGFYYAVIVSDQDFAHLDVKEVLDFHFDTNQGQLSQEKLEEVAEQCYQQILQLWVKNT